MSGRLQILKEAFATQAVELNESRTRCRALQEKVDVVHGQKAELLGRMLELSRQPVGLSARLAPGGELAAGPLQPLARDVDDADDAVELAARSAL